MIKRKFIWLKDLDAYDKIHIQKGDGFDITRLDPQDYEQHREGVDYLKKLLVDGVKLLPILAYEKKLGGYKRLDGFKRFQAHKELGIPIIECFVADEDDLGKTFRYDGKDLIIKHGGQSYRRFTSPVEYGESIDQEEGDGDVNFLYKSKNLKIEYRENIHLHFGDNKTFRICMGRKDFDILSKAIEEAVWEK